MSEPRVEWAARIQYPPGRPIGDQPIVWRRPTRTEAEGLTRWHAGNGAVAAELLRREWVPTDWETVPLDSDASAPKDGAS